MNNGEKCPHCGAADSQTIRDLQKCNRCFGTWVTGSGQPSTTQEALDAARNSVLLAAVQAVRDNEVDPDSMLAMTVRELHRTMQGHYGMSDRQMQFEIDAVEPQAGGPNPADAVIAALPSDHGPT